jgi:hypothetical protein
MPRRDGPDRALERRVQQGGCRNGGAEQHEAQHNAYDEAWARAPVAAHEESAAVLC